MINGRSRAMVSLKRVVLLLCFPCRSLGSPGAPECPCISNTSEGYEALRSGLIALGLGDLTVFQRRLTTWGDRRCHRFTWNLELGEFFDINQNFRMWLKSMFFEEWVFRCEISNNFTTYHRSRRLIGTSRSWTRWFSPGPGPELRSCITEVRTMAWLDVLPMMKTSPQLAVNRIEDRTASTHGAGWTWHLVLKTCSCFL